MKPNRQKKKKLIYITLTGVILCILAVFIADYKTDKATEKYIYTSTDDIPKCKAALLLGTAKQLSSGRANLYFTYRLDAAENLYNSGKISHIVISGDNSRKDYNEPQDMKDALVIRGISEDKITLDYAGFNTYDSVHRMKKIFGQDRFIIISQQFHNQRAIYIAQSTDLEAYGYNARDLSRRSGIKVKLREKLARVKMFLDIIVDREPKFLGDTISIED